MIKSELLIHGNASCIVAVVQRRKSTPSSKLCVGVKNNHVICILSRELAQLWITIEIGTKSPNLVPPHLVSQIHTSKLHFEFITQVVPILSYFL